MAEATPPAGAGAADVVRIAARAYERDRYLAALLAPARARADLIALAAFAGEIARIPVFVSEPMIGEIRLQWWRDTLDRVAAGETGAGHPVADAIGPALARNSLSVERLHGLIDAHAARLVDAPFAGETALASNLSATEAAQFALAARMIGAGSADAEHDLIEAAGQAYGRARLLMELPATLAEQRCLLPLDRLAAHGVSIAELGGRDDRHGLAAAVREISASAVAALTRVEVGWRGLPWSVRSALLPVALVRP